jgi:hypothetical protein
MEYCIAVLPLRLTFAVLLLLEEFVVHCCSCTCVCVYVCKAILVHVFVIALLLLLMSLCC